jgi:hypothetical protein
LEINAPSLCLASLIKGASTFRFMCRFLCPAGAKV